MGNIGNGYVYLVYDGVHHKIGSTINLEQRFARLNMQATRLGRDFFVVHYIDCINHERAERILHFRYRACRQIRSYSSRGSWREETEWFDLSPEQVAEICSIPREEPHTFDDWEDPGESMFTRRRVRIPTSLYLRLEDHLAVRNRGVYPDLLRTTKDQVVEEALRAYLGRAEGGIFDRE